MGNERSETGLDETTAAAHLSSAECELFVCWKGGSASFPLSPEGSVVLGRSSDAGIAIPHTSVSRRHVAIHMGSPPEIEDLGSANGTRLDGADLRPGERMPLLLGSIVELGDVRAVLHIPNDLRESKMDEVRETVLRIAPSDINIILTGETGSGKEVLAEEIHKRSLRANGPFLRLNCAAFPAHLLESELFGYERGAFTGANQAKAGLFESANGGTVLLDEIGELPLSTQPKLLRVLEAREVQRIGALRPRPVDVRFLSATHRDLDVMAVMGEFRQDLLFRLSGISVRVPPLRDRTRELQGLIEALLKDASARARKESITISPAALTLLTSYRWPGNVRELKNVLDRAVLLCEGRVESEHLIFNKTAASAEARAVVMPPSLAPPSASPASPASPATSVNESDAAERDKILKALDACAGNQSEAAKTLGITRRMLIYRLEKLGIKRPRKG